jgi:protein associated with RNAse G/E
VTATEERQCWNAGDVVALRYLRNTPGDVIMPVRVVHDGGDYISLYTAVGTPLKVQATRDGQRLTREIPFVEREGMIGGFADAEWHTNHVLMLHQPGRMSAIMLFWRDPDLEFVGYYGNIQAPLRRTPLGFDTADYLLDVSIAPDLSWRWKDEDEWDLAREHGLIAHDLLDEVRREGKRIVADVEARAWPFDAGFEAWQPDRLWTVPDLPANWDEGLDWT